MPDVTFSTPLLHKNVTVYAVAGDTHTILAVAEANKFRYRMIARTANVAPASSR